MKKYEKEDLEQENHEKENHEKEIEILLKKKREGNKFQQYLRSMVNSVHKHMSRGAEYITKIMTSAHKDQYRGREKKK